MEKHKTNKQLITQQLPALKVQECIIDNTEIKMYTSIFVGFFKTKVFIKNE